MNRRVDRRNLDCWFWPHMGSIGNSLGPSNLTWKNQFLAPHAQRPRPPQPEGRNRASTRGQGWGQKTVFFEGDVSLVSCLPILLIYYFPSGCLSVTKFRQDNSLQYKILGPWLCSCMMVEPLKHWQYRACDSHLGVTYTLPNFKFLLLTVAAQ